MGIESEIARLSNSGVVASASFMPAAAAYLGNDVMDLPQEFVFRYSNNGLVRPGALIRIVSSVMKIGQGAPISGETSYLLSLFSVTPPVTLNDNDPYTVALAEQAAFRGELALGTPVDKGAICYVKTQYSDQQDFNLSGTSLFGRLVTVGGFTATAVARQVLLYGFEI